MGIQDKKRQQHKFEHKNNRLATKLDKLRKVGGSKAKELLINAQYTLDKQLKKKRGGGSKRINSLKQNIQQKENKKAQLNEKKALQQNTGDQQQQQKQQSSKKNRKKQEVEEEIEIIEEFDKDKFLVIPQQLEISKEDQEILKQFQLFGNFSNQTQQNKKSSSMFEENVFTSLQNKISQNINQKLEEKKQLEIQENILNDPKVQIVYKDVAKLMKEFTCGKLSKAFKAIPHVEQWDKLLELTKPQEWSSQATFAATSYLASCLDNFRAKIFYEKYLLDKVKQDIKKHKKLSYHYYMSLKKAFYKPSAWFKGILFQMCSNNHTSIKEAQILGSIISKMSVPSLYSSVALLKLSQFEFTGPTCIFMKVLINKKYALPVKVVQSLVQFFLKYENDERTFPVVWYQLLLQFCKLYQDSFDEMQKESLKQLVKKKHHHLLTPEIINTLENISSEEIAKKNLQNNLAKFNTKKNKQEIEME